MKLSKLFPIAFKKNKTNDDSEKSPREERSDSQNKIIDHKTNMRMMSACIREIYAPISDLCGLQNLMPDIPEGASIYHYAKSMNTCGLLLSQMIENMKYYYLLSSELYEIKISSFALRAELMTTWKNIMEENNTYSEFADDFYSKIGLVTCSININKNVPSGIVQSDSFCILKIFQSILDNAVRFTLEGYINVEVYTSKNDDETVLDIVVSDTGIGIPDDVKDVIFNPLAKAHADSIQGGVGMGLPVSREMCRILGGDLILQSSSIEKGSVFHAYIPIRYNILDDEVNKSHIEYFKLNNKSNKHRGAASVRLEDEPEGPVEMPNILLVEDVKLNRIIVTKMMGDVNIAIETAENGESAVQKCKNKKYNVILMDLVMPIMGGIEAASKIHKECPLNKNTNIIALTGVLSTNVKKDSLKNGMIDYLQKPVVRKNLIETIAKYTERKHRRWIIENSTPS